MNRTQDIKRLLDYALQKEARMMLPSGEEIEIQINEDRGDFIYILKLENLDEDGNQIKDSHGTPIYNWYVGESKNAASRWVQHKTRFYVEKVEEEERKRYYSNRDLFEEWKPEGIEDISSMNSASCGADWTLKHRPIEVVFVQDANKSRQVTHKSARTLLRKGIERSVTEMMFETFGTETVQGGPWCRGPESINKNKKRKYSNVNPAGEFENSGILERLKAIPEVSVNDKDLSRSITGITEDINNITEKDIRFLKTRTIGKLKRKESDYSKSTGSRLISLEKLLEKIDLQFPEGMKDENGKLYKSVNNFLSNALFDVVTQNDQWGRELPGLEWGEATPIIMDKLAKFLEHNGFTDFDSFEYVSPSSSKWSKWLDEHDCSYMKLIREWRRERYVDKYTYLKEAYMAGYGHVSNKHGRYKTLDKIYQNQPKGKRLSYNGSYNLYFSSEKAVASALRKLREPGTELYKEKFARNADKPWICDGEEYTIPAVYSDEIVGNYEEFEAAHLKALAELDEELPLEEKQLLDENDKIAAKYDRVKQLFSKENIYGLCLAGEGAGSLTLTVLQQDNSDMFVDRADFAFYFFKYIKDANSKLGRALLSATTEDYSSLMRFDTEWRKYDTYGDKRVDSRHRKRWKGQVEVISRLVNGMLNFLNTKKRELVRLPYNNSDMYIQNIKDDKFFRVLLDDEDISNFYTSRCVGFRFSRIERFLKPITSEVSEEDIVQEPILDEVTASEFSRWLGLRSFAIKAKEQ